MSYPALAEELGPAPSTWSSSMQSRTEYGQYFDLVKPLITTGGLVVADNVYNAGQGWIDEGFGTDEFNRHVAAEDSFESTTIPVGGGLLLARKR